jgi:hypothetical protein
MKQAFASFWESTGVVLLQPQVPNPNELVTRCVPVLDRFLTASSINVHEAVDEAKDPRKHAFVARVRAARQAFVEEVVAVVSLSRQFGDALSALLESQRAVRAVSHDELVIKATWMHDRFARLLEALLDKTRAHISAIQKVFLSPYAENSVARAARLEPGLHMEEEALRADKAFNPNLASRAALAPSSAKAKRKPVEPLDDRDTWLQECHTFDPASSDYPKMTRQVPGEHRAEHPQHPPPQQAAKPVAPPRMNAAGEIGRTRYSWTEEDGSSELMQHTLTMSLGLSPPPPLMAPVAVAMPGPLKKARVAPVGSASGREESCEWAPLAPLPPAHSMALGDDDGMFFGVIGMVTFDEDDFLGELVF